MSWTVHETTYIIERMNYIFNNNTVVVICWYDVSIDKAGIYIMNIMILILSKDHIIRIMILKKLYNYYLLLVLSD